jgi:hypothetical protein
VVFYLAVFFFVVWILALVAGLGPVSHGLLALAFALVAGEWVARARAERRPSRTPP